MAHFNASTPVRLQKQKNQQLIATNNSIIDRTSTTKRSSLKNLRNYGENTI